MDLQTSRLAGDIPRTILYDIITGDITEHVSNSKENAEYLYD